jgi:hypothetical protein
MADDEYLTDAPRDRPQRTAAKSGTAHKPAARGQPKAPPDRTRRLTVKPIDDEEPFEYSAEDTAKSVLATMIPTKNPTSLVSYYCGVFGLIPALGLLLGPIAVLTGLIGIVYSRKPATAGGLGHLIGGLGHSITGLVLGLIASVYNWAIVVYIWLYGVISLFDMLGLK